MKKVESLLTEISDLCTAGLMSKNARDCLLDISAIVYQIRQELLEKQTAIENDGGPHAA